MVAAIGEAVLQSTLDHVVVIQPTVTSHNTGLPLTEITTSKSPLVTNGGGEKSPQDLVGADDDGRLGLFHVVLDLQDGVNPPGDKRRSTNMTTLLL